MRPWRAGGSDRLEVQTPASAGRKKNERIERVVAMITEARTRYALPIQTLGGDQIVGGTIAKAHDYFRLSGLPIGFKNRVWATKWAATGQKMGFGGAFGRLL
jgi:hypothetical protein